MKSLAVTIVLIAAIGGSRADAQERMLAHDVYFSLKDNSPQAKEKLIAACKKYLTDHPGTVRFEVGSLAEDLQRDVNDRDFDVALHLVFKNKAAYDQYAKSDRHLKCIAENQENQKKVRVFDSYLNAFSNGPVEAVVPSRVLPATSPATPNPRTGIAAQVRAAAAAENAAKAQVALLARAIEAYGHDIGEFPSNEQGLQALRMRPRGLAKEDDWAGPYLDRDVPLDPWQRPYHYRNPGKHKAGEPDIWSSGPDGVDGTPDDIVSWKRR